MKTTLGILGYLILIIGGVYLDAPFIALLAMPLFLAGFVLILIFYLGIIKEQKSKKIISTILIVIGTILLCGILEYAVVEYNQFQVAVDRNPVGEKLPFNWGMILIVVVVNLIAAASVYFGIQKSEKLNESNILFVWLPTLIIIPCTLLL